MAGEPTMDNYTIYVDGVRIGQYGFTNSICDLFANFNLTGPLYCNGVLLDSNDCATKLYDLPTYADLLYLTTTISAQSPDKLITHGLVETVKGIHPPELKIVLDRDYVEIQRGGSTTVTATGYAGHGGTLSYALSGPSRVNITGSTILIGAPSSTTAQTYICTVMLAEVVPAEPTPITYTVSAKLTIEVIIPPAPGD